MGKNKENMSPVKRGMNRNTAPYLLQGMEYLFALNTNIQDDNSSVINITNEESNILAAKFEDGFKVIGKKNDILTEGTYFFLVNPETNESEFGIIKNNQVEQIDILDDLAEPLEEVEQEPYQTYETLIDKGLDLDINYPVKKIVLKNEQCGKVIAFTDNLNPPRLIVLDKLEDYIIQDKEVDPEKIAIFKKALLPKINIERLVTGGRLRRGTYEFLIAYTNKLGEEISEYTSITNPIPIFDKNNVILEQKELADRTNFAIKLKIDNLDTRHKYYKIVVIQNADIEGGIRFFEEGIHPISDNTVIYATEENKKPTSLEKINKTFPYVKKWEGLTESNGHLIGYGITAEKEFNLQPVVNLMGGFVKWQTSVAKENLYEAGDKAAKHKGYMRNETYPLSIRFKTRSGYTTANFPFIARPPENFKFVDGNTYHEMDNVPESKDIDSILANNPSFSDNSRTKMWQFYNTATREGQREVDIEYITVPETVTKYSFIENVGTIQGQQFEIELNEPFTNLLTYIEDNIAYCEQENHPLGFLCGAFDVANYPEHNVPEFSDCEEGEDNVNCIQCSEPDDPIESITIQDIIGENLTFIPKPISNYKKFSVGLEEQLYKRKMEGNNMVFVKAQEEDADLEDGDVNLYSSTLGDSNYVRTRILSNSECTYAEVLNKTNTEYQNNYNTFNSYFNTFYAKNNLQDLLMYNSATPALNNSMKVWVDPSGDYNSHFVNKNGAFHDKIHRNAIWFTLDFSEDDVLYFEVTKEKVTENTPEVGTAKNAPLRISFFDGCSGNPITYQEEGSEIDTTVFTRAQDGAFIELRKEWFVDNEVLVSIDTPIVDFSGAYVNTSTRGIYGVVLRPQEFSKVKVDFESIVLDKQEIYKAVCDFKLPLLQEDSVIPYEYGKFSYVESLETYPDNAELYDSTQLDIDLNMIPDSFKQQFKDYYIQNNGDGSYQLSEEADFRNRPIRHYKFPDNDLVPFMSHNRQASFSESLIFPIGVHIDDEVVRTFLDIAVQNDLITEEQRKDIVAYEIFRGDRTLEKSIEAKGLLYDNYKTKEENEDIYFSNFPFNSLGDNALIYKDKSRQQFIEHPFDSKSNNSFSFISPDNQFRKLNSSTELILEGYQFGNSKSYFSDVEEHPKWTILGDKAYTLATSLAIAETVAEVVIQIAEATIETSKNFWFQGGMTWGGNPIGASVGGAATAVIAGFTILSSSIFKVARYRHEWLTTFRDLGQPENFAAYHVAMGEYNSLRSIPNKGNILRGINTLKNVESGRYSFRHNDTGHRIVLNNTDREHSTYLFLGDEFNINYPSEYYKYDNYNTNFNYSSRPIASEEGLCDTGQSREVLSNIASIYVALKNYVPSQYGTLDSIKWLPTSHISYFEDSIDTIFGGDIFISRMTMKRKMPLFLRDAMKVPSLTPFNYNFYSNLGSNRFFCNYEVSEETNLESMFFPDFKSTFNFDCTEGENGFYVKPPSKFYLYYYGIPSFLVESEINLNYRYAKKNPEDGFYPHMADIVDWTQESKVSIKEPNKFYYNFAYSKPITSVAHRTLPFTYSKKEYDCRYDSPNGAMWSLPDNSEKDLSEPWLIYRPYDSHTFPSSFGKLKDLKGIESEVILGRFENQTAIFNRVDARVEGINPTMGDGMLFRRMQTFTETDLGYLGTQTTDIVSNEYGHFFPDTKRGSVFRIDASGQGMEEISKYSGGKPNGMDKWFRRHLPFKIYNPLIENYENIDVDNAFNGVGISMGWDSKNKRVFLTKKDYVPLKKMKYENGHFFGVRDEMELITDYEADGYTFLGKEGLNYKFSKPTVKIPKTANIFAVINTNDYSVEEARELKAELLEWTSEVSNFKGEVVVITTDSNRWLQTPSKIASGRFEDLSIEKEWDNINTYKGQTLGKEGIVLHFLNSSSYNGEEPTIEFLNDYSSFTKVYTNVDYLKNILITKDDSLEEHLNNIFNAKGNYQDYAIKGTSPQQFIEPIREKGMVKVIDTKANLEQILNDNLKDIKDEEIIIKGDYIDVSNEEFFKDVSWTIAYQVETGSWLSYYSFTPNYYISHNNYFQTGINNQLGKEGVWSHVMSNKSYGVFYGEKMPWTVEYPIKNEYRTKRLQNVTFWTEARRYINDYDFAYDRHITFNEAVIYNSYENSGKLNLVPQRTLSQINQYPITNQDSQDILITNQDYNWTFNNIYNRTLNQDGISTAWITDENQIDKEINNDLVQFGGKKILSYLRGDYFIVRLTYTKSSQHSILLKWSTNQEEIY